MRILQLLTQRRGGPADHAVDVACVLASRGFDSHLIGPDGPYVGRLRAAGVTFHGVSVVDKADLGGLREVSSRLRALRPDVLHCQDRRAGMVGRVIGRVHSVPARVYTFHGVPNGLSNLVAGNARAGARRRRDQLMYHSAERWLNHLAPAHLVAPCAAVRDYLAANVRVASASISVVPNGVDPVRFAPAGPGPATRRRVTALWLGLMTPVKQLDILLRALANVADLELLLVGSGPEQGRLRKMAADYSLADRVAFRGHLDDPAGIFGEADLFVLCSAAEACPLSLLQAMSSGLPVVATSVGGVPELVRPGLDGLLVPPTDVASLTTALRDLVQDPKRRAEMGANARDRVVTRFSLATCVDRLEQIYRGTSA